MVNLKLTDISNISTNQIGRFILLAKHADTNNIVRFRKKYPKQDKLISIFRLNGVNTLNRVFKELKDMGLIIYTIINHNKIIFINPIYFTKDDFIWDKSVFDLFEDFIKQTHSNLEYIKIKTLFYYSDHYLTYGELSDLTDAMSGIYRLYKNNELVYIGKSINIKNRIKEHIKERDIDSFDFTILDNNSDKNIHEVYLIDKYKPRLNKDCIEESTSNVELDDLVFSGIIKLGGDSK